MKTGISTATLSKYETEEALTLLKEAGVGTCEIYLKTFYEYRPEFAKKFASNLGGIEAYSIRVAPYNFEPQLFCDSRRVRGDGFYWLDQVMRSAQLFGAKNYSLGVKKNEVENWDAYIGEIRNFCARFGVNLCTANTDKPAKRAATPYSSYLNYSTGGMSHIYLNGADFGGYEKIIKNLKSLNFDGAVIIGDTNFTDVDNLKRFAQLLNNIV